MAPWRASGYRTCHRDCDPRSARGSRAGRRPSTEELQWAGCGYAVHLRKQIAQRVARGVARVERELPPDYGAEAALVKAWNVSLRWTSIGPSQCMWNVTFAGDATMTAAMLDRLLQHAHVAIISGESYRLRERKRAGIKLPDTNPPSPRWVKFKPAILPKGGSLFDRR